ncbi:sigma factor [Nonomuraea dietziae]|uniref:sigma factor n=1 Tax=Nonomuraea dietziae TaxID=65515 RepID=UPI00341B237B
MDESLLRTLTPTVISILVRRGADFAAAEDAMQDALIEAVRVWPDDPPGDPKGWLVTVAWRKFLDAARADTSRRHREVRVEAEPVPGRGEMADDSLQLYFLCAHPSPLARDRLGEYQAQAAIAALHADAPSTSETDWLQIVEWYDELLLLTGSPVVRLNRAVAVGEADGPQAGLAALAEVSPDLPRYAAVRAYLLERAGGLEQAAELYAEAARAATSLPERDHLIREAARVRQLLQA